MMLLRIAPRSAHDPYLAFCARTKLIGKATGRFQAFHRRFDWAPRVRICPLG